LVGVLKLLAWGEERELKISFFVGESKGRQETHGVGAPRKVGWGRREAMGSGLTR